MRSNNNWKHQAAIVGGVVLMGLALDLNLWRSLLFFIGLGLFVMEWYRDDK